MVVSDVVGLHPRNDSRSIAPAVIDHLVSSEVHVVIDEGCVGVAQNLRYDLPGQVEGGIELPLVFAVAVEGDVLVFITPSPGFGVGGSIDLGNNPHSPRLGIGDYGLDVVLGVDSSDASGLAEFRDCGDVHGECILVSDMPVEYVELGVHHHIDGPLDGWDGEEVTGCIYHEAPPEVRRGVGYGDGHSSDLVLVVLVELEELREGLEASQETRVVVSCKLPLAVVSEQDGIVLLLYITGQELVGIFDHDVQGHLTLGGFGATEGLDLIEVDDFLDDGLSGRLNDVFDIAGADCDVVAIGSVGEVDGARPEQVGGVIRCGGEHEDC